MTAAGLKEFSKPINATQIKRINILKHALALDEEWFKKNFLLKVWEVSSLKNLKGIEAAMTIWEMESIAISNGTLLNPPLSEERKKQKTSLVIVLNALELEKKRKNGGIS